ncbi:hypothetical protein J1P26_17945 [Neobacillus sp. MM2021_6]|uniref:cobalamin biosynthesis protein CobQ n=1 Tax=Bacillaceae TaxID=186817 RepID=UPI00140AE03B|nr:MULTISPECIES: cobalamin biosynthesis protein CobQ [Bacillaceae]MBO0961591.1 hypothetical protein [Neobacillus sp. MM2021_6]NHC19493.1 cobalamin biosynthesis protein CobQ [Bacillus sp. MM2020_4]
MNENKITILSGHYGSGKTEIAINLAIAERWKHEKVAINDLDVINPYFRSREMASIFQQFEVELLAPRNGLAAADLPIVSGEMYRVLHDHRYRVIVDAGGDKDGATALGQYYHEWKGLNPELLFVLNGKRPYVSTVEGALYTVRQIEMASRLKVSGIINNSNIGAETTIKEIMQGYKLSSGLAERLEIPFLYTTISNHLKAEAEDFANTHKVVFIKRYMTLPWEKEHSYGEKGRF